MCDLRHRILVWRECKHTWTAVEHQNERMGLGDAWEYMDLCENAMHGGIQEGMHGWFSRVVISVCMSVWGNYHYEWMLKEWMNEWVNGWVDGWVALVCITMQYGVVSAILRHLRGFREGEKHFTYCKDTWRGKNWRLASSSNKSWPSAPHLASPPLHTIAAPSQPHCCLFS